MGKIRHISNSIGDVEAPTTCLDCKHGVEHRYCLRNRSMLSKSVQKAKGVKLTKDAKPKNSDAGNVVYTVNEFYMKAAAEEPLRTNPAQDASWTGTFILKDEKTSISFKAHPTSGPSKVKEFSKSMPGVLEFELCSYENFLRTVFKGCDPDDEDIGLYFFPDEMIRPNAYISLLEQLSGNCFLKTCIDGVDLLVFTSRVLHKDYRQRNKCDFLWGIYRCCHRKLKGAVEETMVVDTNVDAEEPDVPPGFSPSMRGWWLRDDYTGVPPCYLAMANIKEEVP